ncbi:NAD(P)-dependent oxidoreductase [Dactylosporangium siamense]|uniref:NADH-flavin reductase n=1 Tax=Dactylosporangium siamense TaxID=685454 RepID=A0A919U5N5_9ACTN|nr:NAD(P)H-binding protein [Dactylosporangium siamense]GIG42537.1 NADH-flavin reductase [Dactylosporangium siamense]
MKLTVFGATGGIGRQLVEQGLRLGHEMTAVVRRDHDVPGATVVRATLDDTAALEGAVAGRDAVLSALGQRKGGPATVQAEGARAAVAAMRATGVRRIVSVDAAGRVADHGDSLLMRAVAKPLLQRLLKEGFDDLAEAERVLRASGLDWTLISPPRLTDGGHRPYRTVVDRNVHGGRTLSRADVADAMLKSVPDATHIHRRVNIAY